MNYFSLSTVDTTHLSEKGGNQVNNFVSFVQPLLPDIRRGDAAKAQIAQYYLDHKAEYTDGAVKVLEPLVEMLGVSGSYVRQLKLAREFQDSIYNKELKQFVSEHPVSVQYHLRKIPIADLQKKQLTGEHFSFREAQNVKRLTDGDAVISVTPEEAAPVVDKNKRAEEFRAQHPGMSLGTALILTNFSPMDLVSATTHLLKTTNTRSTIMEEAIQRMVSAVKGEEVEVKAEPVVHHDTSHLSRNPNHYYSNGMVKR